MKIYPMPKVDIKVQSKASKPEQVTPLERIDICNPIHIPSRHEDGTPTELAKPSNRAELISILTGHACLED